MPGSDLRRIAYPYFQVELGHQALEPARVSGGLDSHPHLFPFQLAIELLSLSAMPQPPFSAFSCFRVHQSDLLLLPSLLSSRRPMTSCNQTPCSSTRTDALLGKQNSPYRCDCVRARGLWGSIIKSGDRYSPCPGYSWPSNQGLHNHTRGRTRQTDWHLGCGTIRPHGYLP